MTKKNLKLVDENQRQNQAIESSNLRIENLEFYNEALNEEKGLILNSLNELQKELEERKQSSSSLIKELEDSRNLLMRHNQELEEKLKKAISDLSQVINL